MKLKRLLAIMLAVLLITTLFAGCAKSGSVENLAEDSMAMSPEGGELEDSAENTSDTVLPENRKLIRTLYLDAETEDIDILLPKIDDKILELGGYVEAREVTNHGLYSNVSRHASLTIRIPADKLDAFVGHVSETSNITSNRETTEDITLQYVETESRIEALEVEQDRLLELLAQAGSLEDLLLIESRLTEVRQELEFVKSQLRLYDNQVDYGTIYLEVFEVEQYSQPKPKSVGERISSGFVNSLKGVGNGIVNLFVFLIVALPYLVVLSLPLVITLLAIKLQKRRRTKKAEKDNK